MSAKTTTAFDDAYDEAECSLSKDTLAMHPWVSESGAVASAFGMDAALDDDDVRERAIERVVTAVNSGTVAKPRDTDVATEFLSYPVARVLVSAIDDYRVTSRYIDAEADRSIGALESSLWHPSADFDLRAVLDEFGIEAEEMTEAEAMNDERRRYVSQDAHRATLYRVPVEQFLPVSTEITDDGWSLLDRGASHGFVTVERDEAPTFIRAAIERRVGENLPVTVNSALAERVADEVDRVTSNIDKDLFTRDIDRVEEGLYPPVIKQMLEDFPHHLGHEEKMTLAAFLLHIGMTPHEAVESLGVVGTPGEDPTRYQVNHIQKGSGDGEPYTPANYATIESWGYEWEQDALEQTVKNPLSYYRIKLDDEDDRTTAFRWLDVYDEDVSPMLTYPAGPASMEMDEDNLPEGFVVSENGASWTCDALGEQYATGLALVAVVEGHVEPENLSMKFLREMEPTDAVDLCVEATSLYGFSKSPPAYILEVIGEVYGFEFTDGNYLSKTGKRDALEAFDTLV